MTAEELDALAADVGCKRGHDGCDLECSGRKLVELARGYLSLRLVQADHERQIAALQAAFDDMLAAYLRVSGERPNRDSDYMTASAVSPSWVGPQPVIADSQSGGTVQHCTCGISYDERCATHGEKSYTRSTR